MKPRMKICLLNSIVAGIILIWSQILHIFESMTHANNLALATLRYYFEWVAPQGMLFYDMLYKNGKFPNETREILALLLLHRIKTQRHNYDKLLIEKLSTELYWKRVAHPMFAFIQVRLLYPSPPICTLVLPNLYSFIN